MNIEIAAIGHARGAMAEPINDYADRIRHGGKQIGISRLDITEINTRGGEARLAKTLAGRGFVIALEEGGQTLSSRQFADALQGWLDAGHSEIVFALGGADGLGEAAAHADFRLSLGHMTWPHILARLMLCEQLWRAVSILTGHPYHRA